MLALLERSLEEAFLQLQKTPSAMASVEVVVMDVLVRLEGALRQRLLPLAWTLSALIPFWTSRCLDSVSPPVQESALVAVGVT